MTDFKANELPSLIDTKFSILDEIEKSLSLEFKKISNNIDTRQKIRIERRNKQLIPYKNLARATVFNQISGIYIVGKKFGAGIYKQELESDLFVDDKGEYIMSSYYFNEHDNTSEILKYKLAEKPKKKKQLELVVEHLEELAELGGFPVIQKIVDTSKAFILTKEQEENKLKTEEEKRKIFDSLLNKELIRALSNWSSLREVAAREIIHSSFRTRVERELDGLAWLQNIEEERIIKNSNEKFKIYYFDDEDSTQLYNPHKTFDELTEEEYRKIDQIVRKMKKFDSKLLGYDKEYLLRKQEIMDNSKHNRNFNAPNNYSSETLKNDIFPFLFKVEKLQLTLNQLFLIFQKSIEQYIGALQLNKNFETSDEISQGNNTDERTVSVIDLESIDQQIFDADESLVREVLIEKIVNLSGEDKTIVSVGIGISKLIQTILETKQTINLEYKEEAKDKKVRIIYKNIKFFSIKIGMRDKQIISTIFSNVVNSWYGLEITKLEDLTNLMKGILDKLISSIEHEIDEIGLYREVALDIFHESFQSDISIKFDYEENENE